MPSSTATSLDVGQVPTHFTSKGNAPALARVAVELEETKSHLLEGHISSQSTEAGATDANPRRLKKAKKKVAFHSDKPDLYDF